MTKTDFRKEANKQRMELLSLVLKKVGISKQDLYDLAIQDFIASNLELISEEERKRFNLLVFSDDAKVEELV